MIRIRCKRCGYSGRHRRPLVRCPICRAPHDKPRTQLTHRGVPAEYLVPRRIARALGQDRGWDPVASLRRVVRAIKTRRGILLARKERAEAIRRIKEGAADGTASFLDMLRNLD